MISRKIASQHPDAQGHPKKVGDTLQIGGKPFQIVGIYETGSMILDVIIIMDIETARTVLNEPKDSISCIYVEGDNPADNGALAAAIEKAHPGFDARSMNEAQANFSSLMGQIDTFLLMTVSLALTVGIVGIINTMLMSTTERFVEFGVLRTNGWSQSNILALVTLESAYLGLLAGLVGCLLGLGRHAGRQPVHLGGNSPGDDPVALCVGNWSVGDDGDPGRALPCLACGPAHPHGRHSIRIALTNRGLVMIEVVDVHKSYRSGSRSVEALRGVSCQIDRGRFAFIVGPSGSGKSTLLYLIGAIDRPTSGKIVVDGQDLVTMSEAAQNVYRRDQIGFIFQSFNLISNLTALENVLVPFLPRGVTPEQRQRGVDLLTEVGLGERLDHRPYQLSGGEQQRVAIARALVKQPILVLADEPTGELDSKTGDEIYTILRRLQESSRTTLVVVTHDRRFITPDDLVLEIQDGQLAGGNGSASPEFHEALIPH